jgi:hypothetical protein
MEKEVFTILSQAGTAGIMGLIIIVYFYFKDKDEARKLIKKDNQRSNKTEEVAEDLREENKIEEKRLIKVETLFEEHCKVQAESLACIHNGLNSNANAIKDLAKGLADNTKELAVLNKTIELKFPK